MQKFPKTIYVVRDPGDDSKEDLLAFREAGSCIDDDGPTQVAEYRFVGVRRLAKQLVDVTGK